MDAPSRDSFEQELVSLLPALRRFASRFHASRSDIDDLVQETVKKALANSEKFQPGTSLKSWLFTIMRNTFCTGFRLVEREPTGVIDDYANHCSMSPGQEWSIRGHELEAGISHLPDTYRSAFILVVLGGASYEDAAATSCCAVGTIKSRVSRARDILTKQLG
jgi:RNA polymerase sigma-70 factor (ECF subfamily)